MPDTSTIDETAHTNTNNPDELSHIVNQHLPGNSIADASIFGTEVIALCGHRFIPTKDPHKYPVCEACKHILKSTD